MERVTLKGLLKSEDVAIVVPEIQREYVWGAKESIRNQFIDSLEMRKEQSQSVNLGFLYTYKRNAETYIIDGQQRFTTVILMLYFLSLASDEDKKDFKEIMKLDKAGISFSYRVRSNTEQFMKDLFVSGLREKEEIKDSLWYHSYYDTDKSIQSMLGLLDYLNQRKQSGSLSLTYNKLLDVEFWCYPVEDTSMGEELYITMNSRGKALDNSERLKPLLFEKEKEKNGWITDKEWGKKWDEWEEFFFTNLDDRQNISGVNEAMGNFLLLIWDLETRSQNGRLKPMKAVEVLDLSKIEEYVEALRMLSKYEEYKGEIKILYGSKKNAKGDDDADMIMLKALLSVVYKFKDRSDYELRRVYERIYNAQHRRRILNHVPILKILYEYRGAKEKTFYEVLESMCGKWQEKEYSCPFDKSEMLMVKEMKKSLGVDCVCRDFTETEKAFWSACDCAVYHCHWIWNGDLRIFIEWSIGDKGFDLSRFGHYIGLIEKLFPGDAGHEIDIVRRAWIVGMGDYEPVPVKGGYRSFGWEWSDWWQFISNSPDEFKNFLEDVGDGRFEHYIKTNYKEDKKYSEFAKDKYLLDFTHRADACCDMFYNLNTEDWELCVGGSRNRHSKTVSVHNLYILKAFEADSSNNNYANGKELNGDWKVWWWDGDRIAVENGNLHLVFDLWYNNREKTCKILFKSRNGEDVSEYSRHLEGFKRNEDDSEESYLLNITQQDFNPYEIRGKIEELTNAVSSAL